MSRGHLPSDVKRQNAFFCTISLQSASRAPPERCPTPRLPKESLSRLCGLLVTEKYPTSQGIYACFCLHPHMQLALGGRPMSWLGPGEVSETGYLEVSCSPTTAWELTSMVTKRIPLRLYNRYSVWQIPAAISILLSSAVFLTGWSVACRNRLQMSRKLHCTTRVTAMSW